MINYFLFGEKGGKRVEDYRWWNINNYLLLKNLIKFNELSQVLMPSFIFIHNSIERTNINVSKINLSNIELNKALRVKLSSPFAEFIASRSAIRNHWFCQPGKKSHFDLLS